MDISKSVNTTDAITVLVQDMNCLTRRSSEGGDLYKGLARRAAFSRSRRLSGTQRRSLEEIQCLISTLFSHSGTHRKDREEAEIAMQINVHGSG